MVAEGPFCSIDPSRIVAENEPAFAIRDAYPVTESHTLIIPRRHVTSWFETTDEERLAMFTLVDQVKSDLENVVGADPRVRPPTGHPGEGAHTGAPLRANGVIDGYNLGLNIGACAGQTVWHVHLHLIPRREGDVENPIGGVRNVIPEKGDYKRNPSSPQRLNR